MNGNNDGGRHRIAGRAGAGHPVRSAFFRRDDNGSEDVEMTAEAYLRSLADQEQKSVVTESQAQPTAKPAEVIAATGGPTAIRTEEIMTVAEAQSQQVVMNIEEQQIPVATSAHTRDAARLRSIMRGNDTGAVSRTVPSSELMPREDSLEQAHAMIAPIHDAAVQTAEKGADMAAIIPLPAESTHSFKSAQMPVVETPLLPLEIDIIRPIAHTGDLDAALEGEPAAKLASDTVFVSATPDETIAVEMQEAAISQQASIDEQVEIVAEAPDEAERAFAAVTIVRYPQEDCELVVPEAGEAYAPHHAELDVAEIAQAGVTDVSAVPESDVAMIDAGASPEAMCETVPLDDDLNLNAVAVSELSTEPVAGNDRPDDDRAGPAVPAAPPVSPSLPSRMPAKEEAARKATRLRPPEPRATDVRLPRSVQIAPSNSAPQPAPSARDRRRPVAETRLREIATEASAPRLVMNAKVQQTARPAARPVERPAMQQLPRYEEPAPRVEPEYSRQFESISPMEISKRELAQQPQTESTVDPFAAEFQKKKKLVIAVSTVTVGVILGLGLYAGGADYVSGLFANKHEGINSSRMAAVTTPMPTDRPSATEHAIDPATPSKSHVSSPAKPRAPKSVDDVTSDNVSTAKKTQPAVAQQKTPVTEKSASRETNNGTVKKPAGSTKLAAAAKPTSQEKGSKSEKVTAKTDQHLAAHNADASKKSDAKSAAQRSGKDAFTVQVRATKDAGEAKKIAAKLKAKGIRGVSIVTSDNGGNKLYRVRFGSYGTSADAKSAAGRAGVDGAWVVKQH